MAINVSSDSSKYIVAIEGLSALNAMEGLTEKVEQAAYRAVNKAIDRTRTASARMMLEQVNFGARYLTGQDGRLETTKARAGTLEGKIVGRFRPTSLARFVQGSPTPFKAGVRVAVNPGAAIKLPRAFVIKLRSGSSMTETKYNLGLAVRLPAGASLRNKKVSMTRMKNGLFLLFGPSVDQVFSTVSADVSPLAEQVLEDEFNRLIQRELN